MLPRLPDFLKTVSEGRGIAPYHQGMDPKELDKRLSREFGPGWRLLWNIIRKCWCVFKDYPWNPEAIYEFKEGNSGPATPLKDDIIPKIRKIIELNSNPAKFELAMKLGQKENAEREQHQLDEFRSKLVNETCERLRLQGSVSMYTPPEKKLIGV